MKLFRLLFIILLLTPSNKNLHANGPSPNAKDSEDYTKLVIEAPDLSIRCRSLLNKRQLLIFNKQKNQMLAQKNDHLLRVAPVQKEVTRIKLKQIKKKLTRELNLTVLKISNVEEKIIRQGCPGLVI